MTTEKYANLGETTLSGAYTAASGSLTVVSAATFPTAGVFSIRLDNTAKTLLRVTAIAGTTFTVTVEANDGNADAGDAVVQVGTRATAERWLQSPESTEQRAPSGVSAADYYGPIHKLVALDQSSWSWVNQGSATVNQQDGIVYILSPAAGSTNLRGRFKTAPSPPYTITALLVPCFASATFINSLQLAGIAFRESGTGEIEIICTANFHFSSANAPAAVWAANYNSATSANAVIGAERNIGLSGGNPIWLRIIDDNTNRIYKMSSDKVNWYTIATVGRTAFLTADQVGIVVTNQGGSTDMDVSYLSWEES